MSTDFSEDESAPEQSPMWRKEAFPAWLSRFSRAPACWWSLFLGVPV
jgi:hypothetical protein